MSSYSSLSATRKCQRLRLFRSAMKGVFRTTEALAFGSAYHACIEDSDLESGIKILKEHGMENSVPLLTEMYGRFITFIARNNIEILENEVSFMVETEEGTFEGKIDAILKWNGEVYLGEFKTAKYISYDHVPIDAQITSYLWACDKLNIYNPKGLIWIANKKSMDKEPVVLKNGHLSVAKNQGVSYATYLAKATEVYGTELPPQVETFLEWLKVNDSPSIVMCVTNRSTSQKLYYENILSTLMREEKELMSTYKDLGLVEALKMCSCLPDKMCMQTCQYKDICLATYRNEELTDDDVTTYIDGLKESE